MKSLAKQRSEFQRLLFSVMFCVVAADGDIDEREITELRKIGSLTPFFQDIDLDGELRRHLEPDVDLHGGIFAALQKQKLSFVQQLLVLEGALRAANSDGVIHEKEIELVRRVRSHLDVPDELILDRFGPTQLLFDRHLETADETRPESILRGLDSPAVGEFSVIKDPPA